MYLYVHALNAFGSFLVSVPLGWVLLEKDRYLDKKAQTPRKPLQMLEKKVSRILSTLLQ